MWLLISSLFFSPLVLAIQKAYCKNASDFYLGKKELQTSLEVSSRNFANNGLYWLQFLNRWCTSTRFCNFEIHREIHTSLFVGLHNLFDSNIRIGYLDFILSCCSLFFFTFLVSVVVGIVYKDLHEVLITDQPNRTMTGTTMWGYLLKFLNQMPPQSKIHKRLNL